MGVRHVSSCPALLFFGAYAVVFSFYTVSTIACRMWAESSDAVVDF